MRKILDAYSDMEQFVINTDDKIIESIKKINITGIIFLQNKRCNLGINKKVLKELCHYWIKYDWFKKTKLNSYRHTNS